MEKIKKIKINKIELKVGNKVISLTPEELKNLKKKIDELYCEKIFYPDYPRPFVPPAPDPLFPPVPDPFAPYCYHDTTTESKTYRKKGGEIT